MKSARGYNNCKYYIYARNTRAPRYKRQILLDLIGEIVSNSIIVKDFNTQLPAMDRSYRQKINRET